jgi:hypothetical protein
MPALACVMGLTLGLFQKPRLVHCNRRCCGATHGHKKAAAEQLVVFSRQVSLDPWLLQYLTHCVSPRLLSQLVTWEPEPRLTNQHNE